MVSRDFLSTPTGYLISSPTEGEIPEFIRLVEAAFGEEPHEEEIERWSRTLEPERMLWVSDGDLKVATAGAFTFRLTIPGGEVPAAGVTVVGVLPSHRRRGVLTQMMREQIDDVRRRGEPIAILWASEASIYGRFGYGLATRAAKITLDRDRAVFRDRPEPLGATRLVTLEHAGDILPEIYERVRVRTPGMYARSRAWWEAGALADPEHARRGAGPLFCAVLELDDEPEAYALYRLKNDWNEGVPNSTLRIREVMATSPVALREIWRFLLGVDLVARLEMWGLPPDYPLFLMLTEPRRLRMTLSDALWLRLVDVEAALDARAFADGEAVAIEVHDPFCDWNEGVWRVPDGDQTDADPDLRLDVADLGSAYLGGVSFAELARAGRVEELRVGAIARADALFRTDVTPWCPEVF
jgi:predicted acetyltransferase